jgi:hypothetical protein
MLVDGQLLSSKPLFFNQAISIAIGYSKHFFPIKVTSKNYGTYFHCKSLLCNMCWPVLQDFVLIRFICLVGNWVMCGSETTTFTPELIS